MMLQLHTGAYLRKIRLFHKKTQKQMAGLFGVSRGVYSCWESRYKNRILPKKIIDMLFRVEGILNAQKYMYEILTQREHQREFENKTIYIKKTPLPHKVETKVYIEKESIWKRILRWIKN